MKTITKICPTCSNPFTSQKSRNRVYCSKKCSNSSEKKIRKGLKNQKKTFLKNYGTTHPMKTKKVLNKFKKSMIEKHGVEHALQSENSKTKFKETMNSKYGKDYYPQTKEYLEKSKESCLKKYGVDNYSKTEEFINQYKNTCLEKYGVNHYSKTDDFKRKMNYNTYSSFGKKNIIPNFSLEEFHGVNNIKYEFVCVDCGNIFKSDLDDGNIPQCHVCSGKYLSHFQLSVYKYLKYLNPELQIEINDRQTISPLELDFYIPHLNMAIECDGIRYHTELIGNKKKYYHLDKTKKCEENGIRLIHIFETDWIYKQDIVKSILIMNFSNFYKKIYGRHTEVKEITPKEKKIFLNTNHIQGDTPSKVNIGLYYQNQLVSVMTFGKPRFSNETDWEIIRFCSKMSCSVLGGTQKMFSYFLKIYKPKSIVTYSDKRFFSGEIYKKLGFIKVEDTKPNYWYVNLKNNSVHNRILYQKHKLEKKLETFDPNISEWENMKNNKFDRIWDCGNHKFLYSK